LAREGAKCPTAIPNAIDRKIQRVRNRFRNDSLGVAEFGNGISFGQNARARQSAPPAIERLGYHTYISIDVDVA